MLDVFTLDQLRMFVSIVDEGSFSAAARRVQRVQSAVSHAMANLENVLGVDLWDRSTRVPRLTAAGEVLLQAARRVLAEADGLKRAAAGLAGGLEPSIGLCVDQLYPAAALVEVCGAFAKAFPSVGLTVHTETLQAVAERVLDGTCQLGVIISAVDTPTLTRHHVTSVRLVAVAGRSHPLAAVRGRVPTHLLGEHVQVVLSERGERRSADQGVLSARTWRVADLSTKHELIRAGLGWGNMPLHTIRDDLAKKRLVRIRPEAWDERGLQLPLAAIHRPGVPLGPATRWLLGAMTEACRREVRGAKPVVRRARFRSGAKRLAGEPTLG